MTLALIVIGAMLAAWLVVEAVLHIAVTRLKPKFQWLIGPGDEAPAIDPEAVRQYMQRSFDPELGWLRGRGSSGSDQSALGVASFSIDDNGCRANPGYSGKAAKVVAFGDSYTFCRLVGDDETWPHYLSVKLGTNVCNYGVGNYGIDQATLRLERELPSLDCDVVIMGVVPETMARIHSYWKHYFEYGNVLAFKPRLTLAEGRLVCHPPAVQGAEDFGRYRESLDRIQALDAFYRSKFQRDLLTFPYLPRIVARWRRHVPILWHLIVGLIGGSGERRRRMAFRVVMQENARVTAGLYRDADARELLSAIAGRFAAACKAAGRVPLLLILPQPVDLDRRDSGRDDYGAFFAGLENLLPVVDVSDVFLKQPDRNSLYVDGPLGPHLSPAGNRLVAELLAKRIGDLNERPGTGRKNAAAAAGSASQDMRRLCV